MKITKLTKTSRTAVFDCLPETRFEMREYICDNPDCRSDHVILSSRGGSGRAGSLPPSGLRMSFDLDTRQVSCHDSYGLDETLAESIFEEEFKQSLADETMIDCEQSLE
ncbi:MAG: hypothetical protein ABIJ56_17980 [Pseudomonadota bacterium]